MLEHPDITNSQNHMLNRWRLYRILSEPGALVDVRRDMKIIYGPWNGVFGCWRADAHNPAPRPYVPPWRMFDASGDVITPSLDTSFDRFDLKGYLQARARKLYTRKLIEYGEKIPEHVRKIAGGFRTCQWLALDAMRYVPGFIDFLEQESKGIGLNYVIACWTLAKADSLSAGDRKELNKKIISLKRKWLLANLADAPVDNIFVKSLARLDQRHLNISTIRGLLLITQCHEKAKALSMLGSLSPLEIKLLNNLPKWLAHPKLVCVFKEADEHDLELEDVIPPDVKNAPVSLRGRIRRSFLTAANLDDLEFLSARWSQKIFEDVRFPEPPIPGDNCLVPIRSGKELRKEGVEMSNCVAGYASEVAAGISYFYRWLGQKRATVQLKKDQNGNWYLHESLGSENEWLDDGEVTAITITVTWQLAATANVALTTYVAGTPHYQEEDILGSLHVGQELLLRREPDNPHDHFAIEVFTQGGAKLGYVPRRRNRGVAHHMDYGISFKTRIIELTDNPWDGIIIEIRMDDRFLKMFAPDATSDSPKRSRRTA